MMGHVRMNPNLDGAQRGKLLLPLENPVVAMRAKADTLILLGVFLDFAAGLTAWLGICRA